jgi:arylsulfatase A-like enzyme
MALNVWASRGVLAVAASAACVTLATVSGSADAHDATRPNIVFILSDDQAWTDYGFMGHPHIRTPHLDALADKAAVFPRGYVPTALCRPSLATLITGRYAHQHGITGNDPSHDLAAPNSDAYQDLRATLIARIDRQPTVPQLLAARGYLSHQSGKWWEGHFSRGGFTHGMTRGFPERGGRHGDDGLTIGRQGMEPVFSFIDHAIAEQKPFFLWYAPFMPHTPHTPPARLLEKYAAVVESPFVAKYYAMCEWFDETVGQLVERIEARGLAENTLFVYICDNGWIQRLDGPDYALGSKQSANEGGTRQPILFRWDGVVTPRRYDELVSSIDIVPTMLAAAGAEIPADLPGKNLLPLIRDGQPLERDTIFGEGFAHDIADLDDPEASLLYRWAIRGRWKLLLTYDGKVGRYASSHPRTERRPQLFDLTADPAEEHNVAAEHPEIVADLAARIADWWPVRTRAVITSWPEPVSAGAN